MFKLVLEKAEKPEIKLPTSAGSWKKQESSRKTSISALLTMPKPLTAWITVNCGKFWKKWESQTTWPASWKNCMQVKKQQLERTWNRLVPNRKRSMSRLYIVTLLICLCSYMQSTSWEMLGRKQHKLESRLPGKNINNLRYADDTTFMAESEEELKSPLDERVKEEWKSCLKTQHSKN